jgi:hypothetical protein
MFGVMRTLGLAFGLLGGVFASQGPEFSQQYGQRLGGAIDELRRVVAAFDADAARAGQNRDAAVARMRTDADGFIRDRGEAARVDAERLGRLERQRTAFTEAKGPLARLAAIALEPDYALARATYVDYRPAVPTTEEGLLTALVGFLAGWGVFRLLTSGVRRLGEMRAVRRAARPQPA